MEVAIQTQVLYNNQIWTIDRFLGNIQTWPQTGFLCSIDPKFVWKFLFNILLFARNSNTNQVSSLNFPLCNMARVYKSHNSNIIMGCIGNQIWQSQGDHYLSPSSELVQSTHDRFNFIAPPNPKFPRKLYTNFGK